MWQGPVGRKSYLLEVRIAMTMMITATYKPTIPRIASFVSVTDISVNINRFHCL